VKTVIIEDETAMLDSLALGFEMNGYAPVKASTGYMGLSKIRSENPDFIILDMWLPDIDGLDVLKDLKNWYNKPEVYPKTGHEDKA
jgi:DNA-binding response OmpR family regulator